MAAKGANYKGYSVTRTKRGTYSCYEYGERIVYYTDIITPYSLGIDAERLIEKINKDGIFGEEIGLYSPKEISKRAFLKTFTGNIVSIMPVKDWQKDRWVVTLMTKDDFCGLPVNKQKKDLD